MTKKLFYILFFLSISIRFFHLKKEIDSPHTWRQSDTAYYIQDFYENGINLMEPSVCWLGHYKTLILEFPVIEGFIAGMYHIFGPSHVVARIILLLFFLGSCWFLYKIISFFLSKQTARLSVVLYSLMPLSLFYSRAIHIDFSEMFFVFGMVYYYLIGIKREKTVPLIIGSIFCALAFMVKAPYAVLFVFPLLWYILNSKKVRFVIKNILIFLAPIVVFLIWQNYVFATNNAAPEWQYIPGYRKFTFNAGWYFGSFKQRLEANNYLILAGRIYNEIISVSGLVLLTIGIISLKKKHLFFIYWLIGCIVYTLVFFNLNVVHNYYQIPFTAILAILIASGIRTLFKKLPYLIKYFATVICILIFGYESISYSEKNYYKVENLFLEIGDYIQQETKPNDLILFNLENFDSKCPNFHYPSKRVGWVIPEWGLTGEVVYKLMLEGGDYFATIRKQPLSQEMKSFLKYYPKKEKKLSGDFTLYLYKIDFKYIWDILPEKEKINLKNKVIEQ